MLLSCDTGEEGNEYLSFYLISKKILTSGEYLLKNAYICKYLFKIGFEFPKK